MARLVAAAALVCLTPLAPAAAASEEIGQETAQPPRLARLAKGIINVSYDKGRDLRDRFMKSLDLTPEVPDLPRQELTEDDVELTSREARVSEREEKREEPDERLISLPADDVLADQARQPVGEGDLGAAENLEK